MKILSCGADTRLPGSISLLLRMGHQIGYGLLKPFLAGRILGKSFSPECRQQVIPYGIHLSLKVAGLGCYGDHRIVIRKNNAQLTACTIAPKGIVRAAPELEPVALLPIDADFRVGFLIVRHLFARRLFNPFLRD